MVDERYALTDACGKRKQVRKKRCAPKRKVRSCKKKRRPIRRKGCKRKRKPRKSCRRKKKKRPRSRSCKRKSKRSNRKKRACRRRRSACGKRKRCTKPGPITNNSFLNFLRCYRKKHCGPKSKDLVSRAAKRWCKMKPEQQKYFRDMARTMQTKRNKCKKE